MRWKAALLVTGLTCASLLIEVHALASERDASAELTAIHARWDACREATEDSIELQVCDSAAAGAADDLVARRHHRQVSPLLRAMFEPLVFANGGGEESLAGRVVVTYNYAEFTERRADILLGHRPILDQAEEESGSSEVGLSRLPDHRLARRFQARWRGLRNADCAAYHVTRCSERLDAAFARMINGILIPD